MKKLISLVLAVLMLSVLLVGCGGGSSSTPAADSTPAGDNAPANDGGSGDDTVNIIYVAHGLEDMFCNWLVSCVQAEIDANHPNWNMEVLDGKLSADVQIEQLENAIAKTPDLIFYSAADMYICTPTVQRAQEAGIPVVMIQAPVWDDNDQSVTPYVDCDMYEVGKMVAEYAMQQIPENAQVAILIGPAGNMHSDLRYQGWTEVLATRPDITVVDEQRADWDQAEAMRITEDWLQQYPDLVGVISLNDSMILGAIEAAKSAGRELYTYGVDGMADGCNAVKEGFLTATALQDARALAKGGIELAERVLAGEQLTGEDVIHVDAALITADNVDEFLAIHEANS